MKIRLVLVVIAGLSLAGFCLVMALTRSGMGVNGDSVWYLQGARNLLSGHGYSIQRADGFFPITMFPPFYSYLLVLFHLGGKDIFLSARTLNALLLAITVFLTGWLILRVSKMALLSVMGSALVLLSSNFVLAHVWMLSDSVFIGLTVISLSAVVLYLELNQKRFLLLAGLTAGFSVITRYAGISLLIAIGLTVLFVNSRRWHERFLDMVLVGSIGILPLMGWIIRNESLNLPAVGREGVVLHLETIKISLRIFLNTVWKWLIPGNIVFNFVLRFIILMILGGMLLGAIPVSLKRKKQGFSLLVRSQLFLMIFGIVYVAIVVVSIAFSLAGSPFSAQAPGMERYLLSLFPTFVVLVSTTIGQWASILDSHKYLRWIPFLLPTRIVLVYALQLIALVSQPIPLGYTDVKNYRPDLVKALKAIASERPVVTNNYELLYYLVEKPVYSIPSPTSELTGMPNPSHALLMEKVQRVVEDGRGAVVVLRPAGERYFFDPWLEQLEIYQNFGDFEIYMASE